jgi:hypothetical protein
MFLSAMLLIAAIEAEPPPLPVRPMTAVFAARHPDPNCRRLGPSLAHAPATGGARKLAEAPRAKGQYAVMRSVGGCPVATPMKTRRIDPPK